MTVQDMTVSLLRVDRGSMHVVWHQVIYTPERKHIIHNAVLGAGAGAGMSKFRLQLPAPGQLK
jgi:hypothetical protein